MALENVCFPSDPWPEDFVCRRLDKIIVAEERDGLMGYAAFSSVLDEGSLDSIAVAPERRRQGAADALMGEIVRRGRDQELASITLEVRAGNAAAAALYTKWGFAQVGRRTNYYERPREDAIIMTLEL